MEYQYDGSQQTLQAFAVGAALGTKGFVETLRKWRADGVLTPKQEAAALHQCFSVVAANHVETAHPHLTQFDEDYWDLTAQKEARLLKAHGHPLYGTLAVKDAELWGSLGFR